MDPATVERSTLDWSEVGADGHREMLDLHRSLIALRRAHPALSDPALDGFVVEADEDDRWLVMHRGDLRVVVNFGATPAPCPAGEVVLGRAEGMLVPPESFAVVKVS
jgi:maltooligosyltrehalose trehalohydrolase